MVLWYTGLIPGALTGVADRIKAACATGTERISGINQPNGTMPRMTTASFLLLYQEKEW